MWVTSQGSPHTLCLEQMGADYLAPALAGGGRAVLDYVAQRKEGLEGEGKGGGPTSQTQSNSKPSLPVELIRQQLYLFHLSNYHIIKCMNYKRAKALN